MSPPATVVAAFVHVAAACLLAYLAWHYSIAPLLSWKALFWLTISLMASCSVVRVTRSGIASSVSVGFTVSCAVLVLFNPLVGSILVGLGTVNERDFKRVRPLKYTVYNRSMFVVTAAASSLLYHQLPGAASFAFQPGVMMARMLALALVYFVVNSLLAHAMVTAVNNQPIWQSYPFQGDLLVGYLLQTVWAVVLVWLDRQQLVLTLLLIAPLWALRFSLEKIVELREINDQLVESFADALDMRDRETAGHTRRVAALARLIGRQLHLSRHQLDEVYAAGSLHDLGKIGIPDAILLKAGALDRNERDEIRKHPVMGAALLAPYKHLRNVTTIMRHHHENFDGSGYPDGLAGADVPIGARIIAVADTFVVITDGRPYRLPRSTAEAAAEIRRCAGTQFDPDVVAALLSLDLDMVRADVQNTDTLARRELLRALQPGPGWRRLLGASAA